jgi:thiol:disulfide interchange protein DsbD
LGRSGVPVYVLHRPARPEARTPLVLSELLSPGEVRRALDTL